VGVSCCDAVYGKGIPVGDALFVCPAKLANPVAASQRPHPVHGEENPTRKGVSGERWGLTEAIGGKWSVAKANLIRPIVEASVQKDAMPDS
jgi:hypothetical protein